MGLWEKLNGAELVLQTNRQERQDAKYAKKKKQPE
jgi:hypothetical protein